MLLCEKRQHSREGGRWERERERERHEREGWYWMNERQRARGRAERLNIPDVVMIACLLACLSGLLDIVFFWVVVFSFF